MALISPQTMTAAGPAFTYATVGASDTFMPLPRGTLLFRTAGTGATITVVVPGTNRLGNAEPDTVITMAATDNHALVTDRYVQFADPATGLVTYTTSSQTNHTVAYIVNDPA